ncbi:MAG: 3-dehydroquinate synthase II [Bacillota bacterium]
MNKSVIKEIWFDGRGLPLHSQTWNLIYNSPIAKIITTPDQRKSNRFPFKTEFMIEPGTSGDLEGFTEGDTVISDQPDLLSAAQRKRLKTCLILSVKSGQSLDQLCKEASLYDYVALDFDLPTNIPLELFIARLQDGDTAILRMTNTVEDVKVAFGVLEKGSDGVIFGSAELAQIEALCAFMVENENSKIDLRPLIVTEIRYAGMGMRACIDTTGLMTQEEGMLVGSTSNGGIFVCSETHFLPYMNLRPFRVNAGAVHSYVWMPGDNAEYITDLSAGSRILCVNTGSGLRELTVGRVKIEKRPLLMIKGSSNGAEINVIIQDDWHIRLMGADGKPKNATLIRPGDELLAYPCKPGRHVGIKVHETIIEK